MNDGPPGFDAILDSCLDALLSGRHSLDECLRRYPEHADDLKPQLQMALLTMHLRQPDMPAQQVKALEMRLKGAMLAQQKPHPFAVVSPLSRLVATVGLVLFLTVGVGGGAVAASAYSVPGDFLYGLKRLWEALILALSSLTADTSTTWLHLAHVRLDEVEELARRGVIDESTLVDLYEASANTLLLANQDNEAQIIAYVSEAYVRLIDLPENATTSPVRADLLNLLAIDSDLQRPASIQPPSMGMESVKPSPTASHTPTITLTPTTTKTPTVTLTPTVTATPLSLSPLAPTATSTSRVPATATATPRLSATPSPTRFPSITPTFTLTPLALPGLPTVDSSNSGSNDGSSGSGSASTPIAPTANATIRYRETLAVLIPTLTAQATMATEEVQP